jgi:hypothetical protein
MEQEVEKQLARVADTGLKMSWVELLGQQLGECSIQPEDVDGSHCYKAGVGTPPAQDIERRTRGRTVCDIDDLENKALRDEMRYIEQDSAQSAVRQFNSKDLGFKR